MDTKNDTYYVPKQFIEITTVKMDIHGTKAGNIINLSENVEHTSQYKESFLRYHNKTGNLVEIHNSNKEIATILVKQQQAKILTSNGQTTMLSLPTSMKLETSFGTMEIVPADVSVGCCCGGGGGGGAGGGDESTFNIVLDSTNRIADYFESRKTGSIQMEFYSSNPIYKLLSLLLMIANNNDSIVI